MGGIQTHGGGHKRVRPRRSRVMVEHSLHRADGDRSDPCGVRQSRDPKVPPGLSRNAGIRFLLTPADLFCNYSLTIPRRWEAREEEGV
jgi:hypothetical protein